MKFLLTQLRRIGDVLMTTPSIRALREAFPEAHITFLTEAPADQVLRQNPHLDEILLYPKMKSFKQNLDFIKKLRGERYDCVIDFFGNPRSALLTRLSGAPLRIGFDFRGRSWAYTDPVNIKGSGRTYSAEDKAQLLKVFAIDVSDLKLEFIATEDDHQYANHLFQQFGIKESDFVVSISPVSRQKYKVWPAIYFASIADDLIKKYNAKILFHYGPGEEPFVQSVREHMTQSALPNYQFPSLNATLALFQKVNLLVGNDNGPRHFAVAAGTPTVTVFGRPWAANWTPPNQTKHAVLEYDPGCKSCCTFPDCQLDCLNGTTPEMVFQEIEKMIQTQI